jgi:AcrR family transcriptional regulator
MPVTEVGRSPAATARRAQIITATITVIAEEGFAQASFSRIAARAGLSSTRLISYHFAGKDELVAAVLDHVFAQIGGYMSERVGAATDAWGRLRAYIEGNIEFIDTHRPQMKALLEIVLAGGLPEGAARNATAESALTAILRQGQQEGDFRDFDPRVLAMTVQRSVEGLPFLLAAEPDFDTAAYARELLALFDRGIRA